MTIVEIPMQVRVRPYVAKLQGTTVRHKKKILE